MLNETNRIMNNSSFDKFERNFFHEESLQNTLPLYTTLFVALFISKNHAQALFQHFLVPVVCILLLSLVTVPILLLTIIFFGTIRLFVGLFLKVKYSKQFRGLLPGSDAIWAVKDTSQAVISTVWVIESQKSVEEFVEYVREDVCSAIVNHPNEKLSCTRHCEFGYSFLLKSRSSLEDFQRNCVKIIKTEGDFNRNSLKKTISHYCNREMPEKNTALWEILVFDKAMEWNSSEKKDFAVGFRIHHSLADGISLIKLLLEHFSDTKRPETEINRIISPRKRNFIEKLNEICQFLEAVAFGPAILLLETFLRPHDSNILHGRPLSGQKIVTFAVEKQEESFVAMVKQIKAKFSASGMRFSDVIFAGIAASFRDYYKKRGNIPDRISAVIPALLPNNSNFHEKNTLNNSFSVGVLNLATLSRRQGILAEIHEKMNDLRHSPEYIVNYYLLPVISAVLPEPLLRKIIERVHCTLVVSCLPGTEKLKIFCGDELKDVLFWIPHRGFTGVGISVLSYGGKFQLGLSVDKALLSDDEESAQEIIDGVFKQIQNMYYTFV